jgi:hypothetical protein
MSLKDGELKRKDLYLTSDLYFAAYLLMRGYELLGAIDNGSQRKQFGLLTTDDKLLNAPLPIAAVEADIAAKNNEYERLWLPLPDDPTGMINFKQFYLNIKQCHRSLDEALGRTR